MAKPSARPIRKQDIHFKRSLFRFTISFILVFIFGLLSRVFLHNYPLKEKLLEKINLPEKYELKVDAVAFSFRSGLIPLVGVSINRFDLMEKNCSLRKLGAQNLLLRLDPWALFTGDLKLGRVDLEYMEITGTKNCESDGESEDHNEMSEGSENKTVKEQTSPPSDRISIGPTKKEIKSGGPIKKLFTQVKALTGEVPFRRLSIKSFQVNYQDAGTGSWNIEGEARVDLKNEWVADLEIDKIRFGEKDLSFLKSKWKVLINSELIHLRTESSVREGDLLAQLRIENSKKLATQIKGTLRRIPLSAVMSVLMGDLDFSYLWANCEFETKGPWSTILAEPISLGNCQIDGPYGEIQIKNFAATFKKLKKVELEFNKIVLDEVLENKRKLVLSGVLASYGVLSAKASLEDGVWEGSGFLENSEFIFSNNNLRDIQKVIKIPFQFSSTDESSKAIIGKMDLDDGRFEGEIRINQKHSGETSGRIAVHKIQLHPRIYKLILNSQPTELRIYGKFNWSNARLPQWSAMLATERLQSKFYDLKFLKVKAASQPNGGARLKATISEGTIQPKGPFLSWIEPTYLDQDWSKERVEFTELSSRITVFENREVAWKRGYVRLKNGWQLSSEGQRDSSKNVSAWLQWDRPDRKYLRWNYSGTFFDGQWVPATPWVRDWLNTHPDFLKSNKSVVYTASGKPTLTEKINKAGQKAIEKVKEVLQPKKAEDQP